MVVSHRRPQDRHLNGAASRKSQHENTVGQECQSSIFLWCTSKPQVHQFLFLKLYFFFYFFLLPTFMFLPLHFLHLSLSLLLSLSPFHPSFSPASFFFPLISIKDNMHHFILLRHADTNMSQSATKKLALGEI